eukprot:m.1067334 g.1067334  ORF g.1067334 m.1067334 type:complete len:62 (-) comp24222_c0_seq3:49-234(-)
MLKIKAGSGAGTPLSSHLCMCTSISLSDSTVYSRFGLLDSLDVDLGSTSMKTKTKEEAEDK